MLARYCCACRYNDFFYASLNSKKVLIRERSPRAGLTVAYPGMWVAGVCYRMVSELRVETPGGMG
jgi:hypothetical protein